MAFFCRSRGGIECTLMSRQGNGHLFHLHICMEHLFYMGHTTRFLAYKGGVWLQGTYRGISENQHGKCFFAFVFFLTLRLNSIWLEVAAWSRLLRKIGTLHLGLGRKHVEIIWQCLHWYSTGTGICWPTLPRERSISNSAKMFQTATLCPVLC